MKRKSTMSDIDLNVEVEDEQWEKALPDVLDLSYDIFEVFFPYINDEFDFEIFELEKLFIFNVLLSNDAHIQQLNKDFRSKDAPTNVLSFANMDSPDFSQEIEKTEEVELGDIILGFETCQKEALELGVELKEHFSHLLIHGFLHLLGFEHQEAEDAEEMESIEVEILSKLNIKNPYEEENV